MRLLCVTPFYKPAYVYGGPTRSIPALCEALAAAGESVTVFTTDANGANDLPVTPGTARTLDGVSVVYYHRTWPRGYFYSAGLRSACYAEVSRFDVLYIASNWGYPFLPACRAALRAGVPYVVTPRTSFMRKTWRGKQVKKQCYHRALERPLIQHAAALHYTTDLEVQESLWLRLRPQPVIAPNPVDLAEFERLPARGTFRIRRGIPQDAALILYLGRIEPRKGLDLTLAAFAAIAGEFPGAILVLAGPEEDGYAATLRQLAADLALDGRVVFTGYLGARERLEALATADLFVLTSYSENFGMAVVEAMAAGLPVIVSDQVGLAADVLAARAGVVVPLHVETIAQRLRELLAAPDARQVLGQRAARLAREKYAPQPVAAAMQDLFRQVSRHQS